MSQIAPPCTLVIFGARGDLTKRLLMPALYNLACEKLLDPQLRIIGVDHGDITKEAWIGILSEMMQQFVSDRGAEFHPKGIDKAGWDWITSRCEYLRGDFDVTDTYEALTKALSVDGNSNVSTNAIFYIATAPKFFARVVEGLGQGGLLRERNGEFRRVVIEKPFGNDAPSAEALNTKILAQGDEAQFYRIDHFMGKEPVRGIFTWRFANRFFEPMWNSEHIDHIQITAAETIGVENRGPFYEATGALRDMVPSHLFSVMSMIGMEPPSSLKTEDVRDAHARFLHAITPVTPADAVRGQYDAGIIHGKEVSAYREAPRVDSASRTETYAALRLYVDVPRWRGVPFYVRTGKALKEHTTNVVVVFKPSIALRFDGELPEANTIRFELSGNAAITMRLSMKKPGPEVTLGQADSQFLYRTAFPQRSAVGYESLIYDCMRGQQTLFLREDAIDAGWRILQPIIDAWTSSGKPQLYVAGSNGPTDADALLAAAGRQWAPLG